jgi:hypothetical protein
MTDVLTPTRPGQTRSEAAPASRRPLAVSAAWAGAAAPAVLLAVFWAVALVGWFASDGGSHGTTRTALRIGADAWLMAHGAHLQVGDTTVTAVPLGLSVLCAWVAYRAGRWAGRTSEVEDLLSLGLGAVVLGGTYASVALVTAVLASTPAVAPDPLLAFLGGALVAGAAGGLGLVAGSGLRSELRALLPAHARAVLFGALVGFLAVYAAGALLSAAAVALRGQAVANVLSGLHVDGAGALFSVGLVAVLAPNLAGWGASYLLGPGFSLGTGTVVAPSGVVLGPLPAVPVLAAVPSNGPAPGWALAVLAVPVLCGLYAGHASARRFPTRSYAVGAARAAGAGLLAAVGLAVLAGLSGGSVGGGRMAEVGPAAGATLLLDRGCRRPRRRAAPRVVAHPSRRGDRRPRRGAARPFPALARPRRGGRPGRRPGDPPARAPSRPPGHRARRPARRRARLGRPGGLGRHLAPAPAPAAALRRDPGSPGRSSARGRRAHDARPAPGLR